MLKILINGQDRIIQQDDYYVRQLASGLDEVIFNISIYDPLYPYITEETLITDIDGQTYRVKQIDAGRKDAKVIAQLDLNDWKSVMYVAWGNGIKNLATTVNMILPSGWTVVNNSTSTELLSVNGSLTALEICQECCDIYAIHMRWNNYTKTVTITDTTLQDPVGAFVTRELNMKELNFKGKSNDLVTRLYAYGEDDLTFSSINDGKPYVDNFSYTDEVICGYWKDERYQYAETLLTAAQKKLAGMAVPERSYSCSIVDLQAVDPDKYGFLDFSMFTTATLVDDIKGVSIDYQVVERHIYPYYPEKNEVVFDSAPKRLSREFNNTKELLSEKTDASQVQTVVDRATGVLQTGKSGYVVIGRNSDGYANEIYFLDQPSLDDATNVLRINKAGIGFSSSGVAGPYYQSWTLDAYLSLGGVSNAHGTLQILDADGTVIGRWDKDGIYINGGSIKIGDKFNVDSDGVITATDGNFTGTVTGSKITGSTFGTTSDAFYVLEEEVDGSMMPVIGLGGWTAQDGVIYSNWIGDVENPVVDGTSMSGDVAAMNGETGDAGFRKLYLLDDWFIGSDSTHWDVTRTLKWLDNRISQIESECWQHSCSCDSGDDCDDSCDCSSDSFTPDGAVESC